MPGKNPKFQEIIQQNQLNHGVYNLIKIDKQTQSRRNQAQTLQNTEEQQIQRIISFGVPEIRSVRYSRSSSCLC